MNELTKKLQQLEDLNTSSCKETEETNQMIINCAKSTKTIYANNNTSTNACSMQEEVSDYIAKGLHSFIPRKVLKEIILENNPIPSNVVMERKVDNFMKDLVNDKHEKNRLALDKHLDRPPRKDRFCLWVHL